jgi:predicted Rossmann-fold nucleotide-binding protein
MQAANEGAHDANPDASTGSVGIRVDLPFEQEVNAFVNEAYEHGTFFTRLHHFVLVSDAFVVVPGGIGTVLETMMVWQLLQVQKLRNTPLIWRGRCTWSWSTGAEGQCFDRVLRSRAPST